MTAVVVAIVTVLAVAERSAAYQQRKWKLHSRRHQVDELKAAIKRDARSETPANEPGVFTYPLQEVKKVQQQVAQSLKDEEHIVHTQLAQAAEAQAAAAGAKAEQTEEETAKEENKEGDVPVAASASGSDTAALLRHVDKAVKVLTAKRGHEKRNSTDNADGILVAPAAQEEPSLVGVFPVELLQETLLDVGYRLADSRSSRQQLPDDGQGGDGPQAEQFHGLYSTPVAHHVYASIFGLPVDLTVPIPYEIHRQGPMEQQRQIKDVDIITIRSVVSHEAMNVPQLRRVLFCNQWNERMKMSRCFMDGEGDVVLAQHIILPSRPTALTPPDLHANKAIVEENLADFAFGVAHLLDLIPRFADGEDINDDL